MSLSYLSLIAFWKFQVLYLGCGCMTFDFTTQMTLRHLLPILMNKKLECKEHQIYFKMLRKISETKSSLNFIRDVKKIIFCSTYSNMIQTILKILWWRSLVPCSERLIGSRATLSCITWNISTLLMLVYCNTNSFFVRIFSPMYCLVYSFH